MTEQIPQVPLADDGLLGPGPLLADLRRAAPLVRVRTPAGDPAWLVTRYGPARALWADPRLGQSHPDPARASRISTSGVFTGPFGDFETEQADHAALRALLAPSFGARRMARLATFVADAVEDLVTAMVAEHETHGGPVDLHALLSVPLPLRVVATLLGVPAEDHARFGALTDRALGTTGDDPAHAMAEMRAACTELIDRTRAEPGEDVISDLVAAQRERPGVRDAAIVDICAQILMAGYETVVGRIDLGVLALAEHSATVAALAASPDDDAVVGPVVEELLRWTMFGQTGMPRYAREDVLVTDDDGATVTIAAGDAVLLNMGAANRDPRAFTDPDAFDPGRPRVPHLSFGHGVHHCVGATLARIELREVFTTLARRLPTLRPAVPVADLPLRTGHLTGGPAALPVRC